MEMKAANVRELFQHLLAFEWLHTEQLPSWEEKQTFLFFFKKHIVFSLFLKNSDNSDFERVNNVYYFLQIPGIYSAFILDMFYGFENSVNSIFFF